MKWHSMPSSAPTARNLTLNVIRTSPSEKVDRWAALFCAADLMICGAAGLCPNYTSTPDWWKLRRLSDKWVTGMMGMCPGCDEEGDKIYQELVA